MKLEMGLLNVPSVANSTGNLVNPGLVRIFYPVYGREWDGTHLSSYSGDMEILYPSRSGG